MDLLSTLGAFFGGIALSIASLFAQPSLAAELPSATAVFETSLAAPISSSATSMTLTANSVRGGGTISGHTCFTIDEGTSQAEFTCGTVSGTSVTSMSRGVSPLTGTTTDSDLQFSHRRGASVKITDFPLIQILKAQSNGEDTFPNILRYTTHPTFTGTTDIVDKKYVDDTAFNGAGVIDATASARGVVELATAAEQAASTASGSSGPLALAASNATSTYNASTAANRAVVTGAGGIIDPRFVFNGQSLTFPSAAGTASSTALLTNGSGAVTWNGISQLFQASSSPVFETTGASTTVFRATIPANSFSSNRVMRVNVKGVGLVTRQTETLGLEVGYGTASTTVAFTFPSSPSNPVLRGDIEYVSIAESASVQRNILTFSWQNVLTNSTSTMLIATSSTAVDSTQTRDLVMVMKNPGAGAELRTFYGFMEMLGK